jgi:phospholipid/cholesterol/gamma-HCH transport system substrate-binding protein
MAAVTLVILMVLLPGLLGGAYRLHAYFDDASGLYPSTQVIQEGYVIGIIEHLTPLFPGRDGEADRCPRAIAGAGSGTKRSSLLPCFRVTLRIRDNWPIPADSTAVLGSAGLLQGEAVKIQPGTLDVLLKDGQVLASAGRESDLMAQLEALTLSLRNLVDKTIEPALANIRDQVQTIKDLLGTSGDNTENRDRLAGVFTNLQTLSDDIEKVVDPEQLGAILSSVEQVAANLAQVSATFTERSGDVQRTVRTYGDLAKDIRGVVRATKPSLQRSLDDTQFLLQELSAALVPILTNIEDATRNLSALSRDLRSNPAVIIQGREVDEKTPWFE